MSISDDIIKKYRENPDQYAQTSGVADRIIKRYKVQSAPQQEKVEEKKPSLLSRAGAFAKDLGKSIYQAGKESLAVGGDLIARTSPIEPVRNISSAVREAITNKDDTTIAEKLSLGFNKSRGRKTLYESASGKDIQTAEGARGFIGRGMEIPTYAYSTAIRAVVAAKPLLSRLATRAVSTLPEAGINTAIQTFEEGNTKNLGKNLLANALLMSTLSNASGEISRKVGATKLAKLVDNIEQKTGKLDLEDKIKVRQAIEDGIDEKTILSNLDESKRLFEEAPVKAELQPKTLKPGELAPTIKRIEETYGNKLGVDEQLNVKKAIEEGYSEEAIVKSLQDTGEIIPRAKSEIEKSLTEIKGMYSPKEKQDIYDSFLKKKIDDAGEVGKDEQLVFFQGDGKNGQYVNTKPSEIWHYNVDKDLNVQKVKKSSLISTGDANRDSVGYRKLNIETPIQIPKESKFEIGKPQTTNTGAVNQFSVKGGGMDLYGHIYKNEPASINTFYLKDGVAGKQGVATENFKKTLNELSKRGEKELVVTDASDEMIDFLRRKEEQGLITRNGSHTYAGDNISQAKFTINTIKSPSPAQGGKEVVQEAAEKTKSKFAQRLNDELPDNLKIDEDYDVAHIKTEIDKAEQLANKDTKKALEVALGKTPSDGNTQTATSIVLAEKAKQAGDWETVAKLYNNRRIANTRRGQEIAMEKMSIRLNPEETYMREVVNSRMNGVKLGSADLAEALKRKPRTERVFERVKKQTDVAKKELANAVKIEKAQKIFNDLICK